MNWIIRGVLLGNCCLSLAITVAESDSPIGMWKTFDEKTGRAKSIVQITEQDGELSGKVLQVLESPDGPHPFCKPCEGERKDRPVEGMTILWGAKKNGLRGVTGKFSIRRTARSIASLLLLWMAGKNWKCTVTLAYQW